MPLDPTPLKFSSAKTAFRSSFIGQHVGPLARAYSGMVLLELALKEHHDDLAMKHDVPSLLQKLTAGQPCNQVIRARLRQRIGALRGALTELRFYNPTRTPCNLDPGNYPGMRYLRHVDDHPDGTPSPAIEKLCRQVEETVNFLKKDFRLATI